MLYYLLLGILALTEGVAGFNPLNLLQLAFEKNGLLVLEFDRIFHDLFNGKGATYKKILNALKEGAKTLVEVRTMIDFPHSGTLSSMMEHLVTAGFV